MADKYDSALQMFVIPLPPVDRARLHFVRWLVEHGRLEHAPAGPPSGELVPLHDDTVASQAS